MLCRLTSDGPSSDRTLSARLSLEKRGLIHTKTQAATLMILMRSYSITNVLHGHHQELLQAQSLMIARSMLLRLALATMMVRRRTVKVMRNTWQFLFSLDQPTPLRALPRQYTLPVTSTSTRVKGHHAKPDGSDDGGRRQDVRKTSKRSGLQEATLILGGDGPRQMEKRGCSATRLSYGWSSKLNEQAYHSIQCKTSRTLQDYVTKSTQ